MKMRNRTTTAVHPLTSFSSSSSSLSLPSLLSSSSSSSSAMTSRVLAACLAGEKKNKNESASYKPERRMVIPNRSSRIQHFGDGEATMRTSIVHVVVPDSDHHGNGNSSRRNNRCGENDDDYDDYYYSDSDAAYGEDKGFLYNRSDAYEANLSVSSTAVMTATSNNNNNNNNNIITGKLSTMKRKDRKTKTQQHQQTARMGKNYKRGMKSRDSMGFLVDADEDGDSFTDVRRFSKRLGSLTSSSASEPIWLRLAMLFLLVVVTIATSGWSISLMISQDGNKNSESLSERSTQREQQVLQGGGGGGVETISSQKSSLSRAHLEKLKAVTAAREEDARRFVLNLDGQQQRQQPQQGKGPQATLLRMIPLPPPPPVVSVSHIQKEVVAIPSGDPSTTADPALGNSSSSTTESGPERINGIMVTVIIVLVSVNVGLVLAIALLLLARFELIHLPTSLGGLGTPPQYWLDSYDLKEKMSRDLNQITFPFAGSEGIENYLKLYPQEGTADMKGGVNDRLEYSDGNMLAGTGTAESSEFNSISVGSEEYRSQSSSLLQHSSNNNGGGIPITVIPPSSMAGAGAGAGGAGMTNAVSPTSNVSPSMQSSSSPVTNTSQQQPQQQQYLQQPPPLRSLLSRGGTPGGGGIGAAGSASSYPANATNSSSMNPANHNMVSTSASYSTSQYSPQKQQQQQQQQQTLQPGQLPPLPSPSSASITMPWKAGGGGGIKSNNTSSTTPYNNTSTTTASPSTTTNSPSSPRGAAAATVMGPGGVNPLLPPSMTRQTKNSSGSSKHNNNSSTMNNNSSDMTVAGDAQEVAFLSYDDEAALSSPHSQRRRNQ